MIFALVLMFLVMAQHVIATLPVVASFRGKKYDVKAKTAAQLCGEIESMMNLPPGEQRALFRGKVLKPTDVLSDVGVSSGDVVTIVKGQRFKKSEKENERSASSVSSSLDSSPLSGSENGFGSLGGFGSEKEMKEAMDRLDQIIDSDVFSEYVKDEESLERARQSLLDNIDKYEAGMPGFREQAMSLASDKDKWREAMMKAKEQVDELRQRRDVLRKMQQQQQQQQQQQGGNSINNNNNNNNGEKKDGEENNSNANV